MSRGTELLNTTFAAGVSEKGESHRVGALVLLLSPSSSGPPAVRSLVPLSLPSHTRAIWAWSCWVCSETRRGASCVAGPVSLAMWCQDRAGWVDWDGVGYPVRSPPAPGRWRRLCPGPRAGRCVTSIPGRLLSWPAGWEG